GHHRFTVARKLGIPVKYVVCDDAATIHELEKATTRWSIKDFLVSFVRCGDPAYITVYEYHKRTGIQISACISMLGGESAGSSNKNEDFKAGQFRLGDPTNANTVADLVLHCKSLGIK